MMLFYFAALFTVALAKHVDLPYVALHNPDLFQGDIIGVEDNDVRNAIPDANRRWLRGIVPYVIDSSLIMQKSLIIQAMQHITSVTGGCIKFQARQFDSNYVRFIKGEGCYSNVGCVRGAQPISLGNGCHYVGTIVHEILHALGFYHEQNRSDRDQYLIIYWSNIQSGMESQFALLQSHQNTLYTSFDYHSIMIYGEYAFSKSPGRAMTMQAKQAGVRVQEPYTKQGMTSSDVIRVKKMYGC